MTGLDAKKERGYVILGKKESPQVFNVHKRKA